MRRCDTSRTRSLCPNDTPEDAGALVAARGDPTTGARGRRMDETVNVNVRFRWLVVPALCMLVAGLVLAFQHRRAYYPGLLILAGFLGWLLVVGAATCVIGWGAVWIGIAFTDAVKRIQRRPVRFSRWNWLAGGA